MSEDNGNERVKRGLPVCIDATYAGFVLFIPERNKSWLPTNLQLQDMYQRISVG